MPTAASTETPTFRHTPDMGEISGFGGGYENACQNMLEAGVKFLVAKSSPVDFKVVEYKNIYGVCKVEGDDAKALEKAVLDAAHGDCTGAMHQTVMSRLAYIAKNGWASYCDELRKHEADEAKAEA